MLRRQECTTRVRKLNTSYKAFLERLGLSTQRRCYQYSGDLALPISVLGLAFAAKSHTSCNNLVSDYPTNLLSYNSMADKTESARDGSVVVPRMDYFTKVAHHDTYERISPTRPELSVQGKTVVVTGGGTGIGKSIAIAFAQAGARSVAILGRRADRLEGALEELKNAATSDKTILLREICDLADQAQTVRAFDSIVKSVGPIDILISNAGALPDLGPLRGFNATTFMHSFELNVLTALNAVQAFLPRSTTHPTIISVSSCIAHISPMPNVSGYAVSKAANLKLMDYLAAENPELHLVNLQPGTITTEMSAKAGVPGTTTLELPAHFCVWLASPEAKFLRSKFVWANWDVDELITRQEEIRSSRLFTWLLEGIPM